MSVTAFKTRLDIAGLPECPLHSIRLRAKILNLTRYQVTKSDKKERIKSYYHIIHKSWPYKGGNVKEFI